MCICIYIDIYQGIKQIFYVVVFPVTLASLVSDHLYSRVITPRTRPPRLCIDITWAALFCVVSFEFFAHLSRREFIGSLIIYVTRDQWENFQVFFFIS